jgi:hypothetical protein
MAIADYTPSVGDIATLIPARATGRFAGGAGTPAFPDQPRVEAVIKAAAGLVSAQLGGANLAEGFYEAAKTLIILKVACLLEPAAWPEQARPDKSAWEQWKAQYDEDLAGVVEAVKRHAEDGPEDTGPGSSQTPVSAFPPPGILAYCPEEW